MAGDVQRGKNGSGWTERRVSSAEPRLERWVRRWRDVMVTEAMSRMGDRDAAEDIVQDAIKKVLAIARLNPEIVEKVRNPRSWLILITRNVAYDVWRTAARREKLRIENEARVREALFPDPGQGHEADPRSGRILESGGRLLTGRQFAVVDLMLTGMNDAEIAGELKIAPGTVRRHRGEAIRTLREHLCPPTAPG